MRLNALCIYIYIYIYQNVLKQSKAYPQNICSLQGHAVAQVANCCLPTAVARVRVQAACGVCGGQSGAGAGFL
jgi:hypothetical protein